MDFFSNLLPEVPSELPAVPNLLDPTSPYQNLTVIQSMFSAAFLGTFIANLAAQTVRHILEPEKPTQERYSLENHPLCGITTGGREECWWKPGCYEDIDKGFFLPPNCLAECYPADHCLSSLIRDYQAAGGICPNSELDVTYPGVFNVSEQSCEVDYDEGAGGEWGWPVRELCSNLTKELLKDQENCIIPLYTWKQSIWNTARRLVQSMCDYQTLVDFYPKSNDDENANKLTPINEIHGGGNEAFPFPFARVPPLQNTKERVHYIRIGKSLDHSKLFEYNIHCNPFIDQLGELNEPFPQHRYPWLCSLRRIGQQSSHQCGAVLLSTPPGPTVIVTSAHCVNICKSEDGRQVPNCCCPNVGPGLCNSTEDCGTNARSVVMTGAEAEVKCGEWDTASDLEEDYNVTLPIVKISVHPDFNISRGEQNSQFVVADIATIHVSDDNFEAQSRAHHINPACLPIQPLSDTAPAVHSGWSIPPPRDYLTAHVPAYLDVYQHFSKQWHNSMNLTKCEDPKIVQQLGGYDPYTLNHPTNSYYPPGTICAVEKEGEFCPTSGESGSPLMVKNDDGRMVAEGISSFIKGCSIFEFNENSFYDFSFLRQRSDNPAVYTKLSCYLPWVATQYDMEYKYIHPDPACQTGNGIITEATSEKCRTNPFNNEPDRKDGTEAPCLFPFTLNGEFHTACIMDELEEFSRPIFRCPIRTVKDGGPNGTTYTDNHLTGGNYLQGEFCPTNSVGGSKNESGHVVYVWEDGKAPVFNHGELELDPELPTENCGHYTRPVFATCKNNCPGGGFALLATTALVSPAAAPVLPLLLAPLGLVGVAGTAGLTIMAMSECGGPRRCVASSGQCCSLSFSIRGIVCPESC